MKFLLDNAFPQDNLIVSLKKRGLEYEIIPDPVIAMNRPQCPRYDGCFFMGGLRNGLYLSDYTCADMMCDPPAYKLSNYLHKVPYEYLLNKKGVFLTWGLLKTNPYQYFPVAPRLFVRPDSGMKPFPGGVFKHGEVADKLDFYYMRDDDFIFVAPYQHIVNEWRFIVRGTRVLCGSPYNDDDRGWQCYYDEFLYETAKTAATKVAAQYSHPEPFYTLDMARVGNQFLVVEINSLSCSCLYSCNTDVIVDELLDYFNSCDKDTL